MSAFHRSGRLTGTLFALCALGAASVVAVLPAAQAATPKCFGHRATIVGTNGDDELEGTNQRDVIVGRGGNDTIDAKGGKDFVCGGGGDFDVIYGRGGNDDINGGRGFDVVFPGSGDDFVNGAKDGGFVTYEGSLTPINADLGTGVITGDGRDEVRRVFGVGGSEANDVIVGNDESNDLWGFGGNDVVTGLGGDDFLNAGAGDDTVAGGDGVDILDLVVAHGGPAIGDDVLATSGATVDMPAGTVIGGSDVGSDTFTGIERVGATLGNDTLTGDAGDNELVGWAGTDTLLGGDGNDFLIPGPDDDTVDGGAGTDAVDYFLSHPFEPGLDGPVTVDLEAQTATGQGADNLVSIEGALGTVLDDTLLGSKDADFVLMGDEGSDTISGLQGDDYLDGDAFFFDFPEEFPGTDALDGGPGEDTCLGGETNEQCETLEPPPPSSVRRATVLNRYRSTRNAYTTYGIVQSVR